ncbi:MAG: zinc ABC transporter substrate-binding protein [Patescibacteria group bacterium]|nr:zinc ABC transporter substrate-binding protein [Patescibacteria group bacterium]
MKRFIYLAVLAALVIAGVVALWRNAPGPAAVSSGKLRVTASFYPMYYFASMVGGPYADVTDITPAGAEPHDYEPTPQDIVRIETSDILVLNGNLLEPWGDRVAAELVGTPVRVIVAGQGLADEKLTENGASVTDPHIWLDPVLAKQEVQRIADGFVAADPAHGAAYQANAKMVENALDTLDRKFQAGLNSCARTDFVTSHAAFGYLASQYGLNQIAITGVSPDQEPSTQALAALTQLVKQNNIRYIFFERLISPKLADTLAQETGAQTLVLDPIEGLTASDLAQGKDYVTQMEMNLQNLRLALSCR